MEQPTIYNDTEEGKQKLIDWLIYDLDQQRKDIANRKRIERSEIKDGELRLYIGHKNRTPKVEINFDFNFNDIMSKLIDTNKYGKYTCPYKLHCVNVTFDGEANFSYSTFEEYTNFSSSKFIEEVNFSFSKFVGDTYFSISKFMDLTNFSYSTFGKYVFFSGSIFESQVDFSNIKITNSLNFENIKLNEKSYLDFRNINYDYDKNEFIEPHGKSEIKITNTVINGRIDFNNLKIKNIDFACSNVMGDGVVNRINFEAECKNWETATFLKNEELKRNNTIKALEYKAIEKDKYSKELKTKKLSREIVAVRFSIWLSKLSNNHGQDWLKALKFTAGFGAIFLILSYIPYCINIIFLQKPEYKILLKLAKNFIPSYFEYLIPTKYNFIPTVLGKAENIPFYITSISSIFYFVGKITIGYGMVEIVQAFRKLNSK